MRSRTPFRNNAPLVLGITAGALLLLFGVQGLIRRSGEFSPDFLASVLLFGMTVLNLTLLLVLLFVLGRNVVRVVMERRRGTFGARFRMRLLSVFLLMAVAPSLLVLFVGSDLIQQSVDRWFNVDVERILSSSQALGTALRAAAADRARVHARFIAREIEARRLLDPTGPGGLRRMVETRSRDLRLDLVNVFGPQGELVAVMDPRVPGPAPDAHSAETLAEIALLGREAESTVPLGAGELVRVAVPVRAAGRAVGAVVASNLIPRGVVAEAEEVEARYTKYRRAEASREPIKGLYLSLYLFPALLVLFGATWLSLYLARRITIPLRLVAEAAERIANRERAVRVEVPPSGDEFAALAASFNRMSERLARSEEEVEISRQGLTRKNEELEERRRLTETVLETVGTGVVVVDAEGTVTGINAAACRLLDVDSDVLARRLDDALRGPGRDEIVGLVERLLTGRRSRQEREIVLPVAGRERHLAATVVGLPGAPGSPPGAVVVLDDLTPLMRAQKVAAWGEVAKKLAHEIKNPLTPIQLSAQRVRKAYLKSSPELETIITESTSSIVREVEALKTLVDEFSQFARLPAAHLASTSLNGVIEDALALYEGLFADVRFVKRLAPDLPAARIDAAQIKRVLINLIDNAIEAMKRRGTVELTTGFDRIDGRVRIEIADDGPGIRPEDRDRLFVPSFSTKKGGSGLGLAIVSRIVQEHHGTIRVEDVVPRGVRFVVELPV
jgi:two-component system nitrogen regulation sensor histidine kinase NtrY